MWLVGLSAVIKDDIVCKHIRCYTMQLIFLVIEIIFFGHLAQVCNRYLRIPIPLLHLFSESVISPLLMMLLALLHHGSSVQGKKCDIKEGELCISTNMSASLHSAELGWVAQYS